MVSSILSNDMVSNNDNDNDIKKNEKRDKCLEMTWEITKLFKIWVTVMPDLICTLATAAKGLERGLNELKIGEGIEIIQTTQ